jgi:type II secretion system protein G
MLKMKKNQKGFTLIEVLLVVVILGILAAVALPRFMTTKAETELNTCRANLSAINSAAEEYHFKNDAYPSVGTDGLDELLAAGYLPDGIPDCPQDADGDGTDYTITAGTFRAACAINAAEHTL